MADSFAADIQEIQKFSKQWDAQAQQVGKLTAQLSTIESHLGALLENSLATTVLNVLVGASQLDIWNDFRSKLNGAAGALGTLQDQVTQDSQTLHRCWVEYQIADQAAADGFQQISDFDATQTQHSPISQMLDTLSSVAEQCAALTGAQQLVAESPGSVAKQLTDTGPGFVPLAELQNEGLVPSPTPAPTTGGEFGTNDTPDRGGGETNLG
jgi:hypothetical protein